MNFLAIHSFAKCKETKQKNLSFKIFHRGTQEEHPWGTFSQQVY
jgi:hypothetical protein